MVVSIFYLILSCLPYKMPSYYETQAASTDTKSTESKPIKHLKVFLTFVFLFYMVLCATERIFQTMATVLGLCGPLDLGGQSASN